MSLEKSSIEFTEEDLAKFDWLTLHKDMQEAMPMESTLDKFVRKSSENPFVPIGVAATSAALIYGIWSFRMGRKKMSQYMMRTRVAAQGFTILAIVGGYVFGLSRK